MTTYSDNFLRMWHKYVGHCVEIIEPIPPKLPDWTQNEEYKKVTEHDNDSKDTSEYIIGGFGRTEQ